MSSQKLPHDSASRHESTMRFCHFPIWPSFLLLLFRFQSSMAKEKEVVYALIIIFTIEDGIIIITQIMMVLLIVEQ